ncbi:thioredoxin domain-containing protein 5 [Condylostylus longicornis]|uniref:thioredoxin domain-containing protein 5 n=1 Tax=Condylostylus longicornis TaxID=2530218 RepID=UPI00244DCE15|nr:thioredoxin domain-containing protein 5 [Condylostylus longicornis]
MFLFSSFLIVLLMSESFCEEESKVVKLGYDNFEKSLKSNNYFVDFFAPWCGHCKRLTPIWEELANEKNHPSSNLVVAEVDCTNEQELCADQSIKGYPTIILFKKGEAPIRYLGHRDMESMKSFLNEHIPEEKHIPEEAVSEETSPIALVELDEEIFQDHINKEYRFIEFYAPWCGHCQKLAPTWEELAESMKHLSKLRISRIDCTMFRPICQEHGVKSYPTLLWFKDGEKVEKYSGSRSLEDFKAYITKMMGEDAVEQFPPEVSVLNSENFYQMVNKGYTFVKFYAPWCGHCRTLEPVWEKIAKRVHNNYRGMRVAKVDCTKNRDLCNDQQIEGYPTLFLYKNSEKVNEYYGERDYDDLLAFVDSALTSSMHDEL